MYPESIPADRPACVTSSEQNPVNPSAQNQGGDLMGQVQGNPEFTKWWRRWISRVQRMHVRKNLLARRPRIERHDEIRHRNPDLKGASRDCEFKRYL
jgi:hypothetical protein